MVDSRLIDMSRFTNCMISGMSSDQISAELDLNELEDIISADISFFLNEPGSELDKIFGIVPDNAPNIEELEDEDVRNLECEVTAMEKSMEIASTGKQEKLHVKMLEDFLQKYSALNVNLLSCDGDDLAKVLRLFFGSLKKKDGGDYAPASLICIRASIHCISILHETEKTQYHHR